MTTDCHKVYNDNISLSYLSEVDGEDGMTTTAVVVHVGGCCCPVLVTAIYQLLDTLVVLDTVTR